MPVTLIGEAVFSRCLSALKDERGRACEILSGPTPKFEGDKQAFVDDLEQALYASKIISYAQGFMLIQNVSLLVSFPDSRFLTLIPNIGRQGVQVEAEQAFHCPHVARWLHHPLRLP